MTQLGRYPSDPKRISTLITAFYGSAALFAAAELGIFIELSRLGKSSAAALARTLQLDLRNTTLLLDACAALGLLEKEGDLYRNSLDGETYLIPGRPLDLSGLIRASRDAYPLWQALPDFIRTGTRPSHAGCANSGSLTAELLSRHARTLAAGRPVIRRLDLQGRKRLLEVEAGPGTYSVLISLEFPELHCTIFDRPDVIRIASALIGQQEPSLHVSTLEGDSLTTPFPSANDVVLLFDCLHRHTAGQIPALIRRAADSLNPGGLMYVMDVMTDETHTMPAFSALFALNVALTNGDGHIFSHAELQRWMEEAGLRDFAVEMLPSPSPQWLARGRKP